MDPRAVTTKVCDMVGIDPKGAQHTWDPVPNNFLAG